MVIEHREGLKSFLRTSQPHNNLEYSPGVYQFLRSPVLPEFSKKFFNLGQNRIDRQRAIFKNGTSNVYYKRLEHLGFRYICDAFNSLIDIKWRWTLVAYALAYFVSWLLFSLIWWLIMFTHGDLEDEHLPPNQAVSGWTPCVLNIHNFTSCYLFSLETQSTVGYGLRVITEECPQAIFMMNMQNFIGLTIDAFFIGLAFAKLTRPILRTQTVLFSKNALIAVHDGEFNLMFRVGDMRKKPLIGASIRAEILKPKKTKEGENLKTFRTKLTLGYDGEHNDLFLLWPLTVYHKIDDRSPLFELNSRTILREKFEIIIVLEATEESTGQSFQARTSYVNGEILWGQKFDAIVDHLKDKTAYEVVYSRFDNTYRVETPSCSSKEWVQSKDGHEINSEITDLAEAHDFFDENASGPSRPIPVNKKRVIPTTKTFADESNSLLQFDSSYL